MEERKTTNNNNNNAFAVLNEELRRDVLIASVSNADHLSETLEQAHKIATKPTTPEETILNRSTPTEKQTLVGSGASPGKHGAGHGKFGEETTKDGIRKVRAEVDVARGRAVFYRHVGDVCVF